jgi:predicted Zn finger-like uncharacterized protein
MIVTCDHCGARYRLDESKIPGRGARVTCPSCRHVFVVYRRDSSEETPAVVPSSPSPPARPSIEEEAAGLDVNTLDFRSVGITSWKVKVKIGLIYDFNDYKTFNKNIRDGRVTATDLISFDGSEWSPIGDLSALSQRFCQVYVRTKRAAEAVEDELDEDEPTRIMTAPTEEPPPRKKKSLIGPADESFGPAVAVGRGGPALEGADALADALADAEAEVDAGEGWKSGKADANQPPRFVDPFDKKGPPQRTPPPGREGSTATRPEPQGGSGGLLIAAALLGIVLLGGGYWFLNQNSNAEVTTTPEPVTNPPADPSKASTNPDQIRENLLERIQQGAEPVEDPVDPGTNDWGIEEEPELIPVVPEEFRDGGGGTNLEQNGTMSVGGSGGASSHAAEGDAAAQSASWSAAAAAYQKAVELEPRNVRYLEKLCEYRYRSGNVSSARSTCSQARQAGSSAASKWLGHISYDQGDMSGAVGHYQSYLSSNPADRNEIQRRIDSISGR